MTPGALLPGRTSTLARNNALRRLLSLLVICLGVSACGTTQVAMPYTPAARPAPAAAARPVVAVGNVSDERRDGREDANWIGTIRDGYGIPVKRLEAPGPVRDVVRQAFADALAARGLLAPAGAAPRYELTVRITQFDANQYVRREATADFQVTLTERGSNRTAWSGRGRAQQVDGNLLSLSTGVFASVDDLRQTALRTMSEAIDRALDDPAFRAALR